MIKLTKMIRVYLLGMMTFLSSVSFAQRIYYNPEYIYMNEGEEIEIQMVIQTYGNVVRINECSVTLDWGFIGSVSEIRHYKGTGEDSDKVFIYFRFTASTSGSDRIRVQLTVETQDAHYDYHNKYIDIMVWNSFDLDGSGSIPSTVDSAETVKSEALKEED